MESKPPSPGNSSDQKTNNPEPSSPKPEHPIFPQTEKKSFDPSEKTEE